MIYSLPVEVLLWTIHGRFIFPIRGQSGNETQDEVQANVQQPSRLGKTGIVHIDAFPGMAVPVALISGKFRHCDLP